MIDVDAMQDYIRDANPIPTLDDLDPDELTAFVTAADTRKAAVMQAPTQHPTSAPPVASPPPRRRKAWAFAVAFIVVVAAVGIAALVVRSSGDGPVADEPMTPIQVESLTWSRVPQDEAVFNPTIGKDMMWSVTRGGPGFVAVGKTGTGDAEAIDPVDLDFAFWNNLGWQRNMGPDGPSYGEPAVWISEDGITWSMLPEDASPGFDRGGVFESVTAGGPGLVAVGADISPPMHPAGPPEAPVSLSVQAYLGEWAWDGAVWASDDGLAWRSAELAEPGGGLGWFNDITVGGPGLVAVGTGYVPPGEPAGGEDHAITAAVWTSPDGLTWTRVPHDPDVFGSGNLYWSMDAVAVGGPGLVAVGTAGEADDPWNPAVWTSPDGLSWTLVPPTELPGDEPMFDVVAGGPGLVAVGGQSVWTSPNGLTWTLVSSPELPDSAHLWSVTSVGSELVAVGSGVVWTSVDGVTWTEADLPGVGDVFSVAATDDRLIAVGAVGRDGGSCTMDTSDCAAAVWIATEG